MENYTSFIGAEYLKDLTICDRLINLHKQSPLKGPGYISKKGGEFQIDPSIKDSTDLSIHDYLLYQEVSDYISELHKIVDNYAAHYEAVNRYSAWAMIEPINIQHYKPGGAYNSWHTERSSAHPVTATRHLVFMTYLNDVTEGGQTEFYYQDMMVQPKRGLTLVWPADWTHTHRGVPSMTQEKYIITGWFNYTETRS
jgi:hypothetical protein